MTIAVQSGSVSSAGITIVGAQNSDVIVLGSGHDTVYLGAGETLAGNGGVATVHLNAASAGDKIGGTGTLNLVVDGGGTVALGNNVLNASSVTLSQTTTFAANSLAGLSITGSAAGHDVIVLGAAGQSVNGGGAAEHILAQAAYAGDAITGAGAGSVLEIYTAGSVTLNAADTLAQVRLDQIGTLALNQASFVTAIGEVQGSTLLAGGAAQTLSSVLGGDTLVGAAAGGDVFRGTAAGLSHDYISTFLGTDSIDLTNLAYAGATLKTTSHGADTGVVVTSGHVSSSFTLAGAFSATSFTLASDGGTGLAISLV